MVKTKDNIEYCVLCNNVLHISIPIPEKYRLCCCCLNQVKNVIYGSKSFEGKTATAMRYKNGKFSYYEFDPYLSYREAYVKMDKKLIKKILKLFSIDFSELNHKIT